MKEHIQYFFSNKKYVRFASAVLVLVLAIGMTAYAAYVNQAYKKGVASTTKINTLFSSNYLKLWNSEAGIAKEQQYVVLQADKDTNQVKIQLAIRNYYGENTARVNSHDINYALSIRLSGATTSGNLSSYLVEYSSGSIDVDAPTKTWEKTNCVLTGRKISENIITITMPKDDLGKVSFEITASPENTSYTNGFSLAGIILPVLEGDMRSFQCEGSFIDADTGKMPKDYDAFNYEVSISTGIADITLTWDPEKVEIDPYFLKRIGKTNADIVKNQKYTISYEMDYSEKSNELIQFYRKTKPSGSDTWQSNWDEMNSVISVTGAEKK